MHAFQTKQNVKQNDMWDFILLLLYLLHNNSQTKIECQPTSYKRCTAHNALCKQNSGHGFVYII